MLERAHPRVFRMAGAPRSPEQDLLAALLAAGPLAVVSHRGAAWLWRMIEEPTVEITVPVGRLPRLEGVVVHRSVDIDRAWRGRRRGITVTSPMRALVDLGAIAPELVEDALDEALIARYCTIEAVHRELHRVAQHGRNGAGVLREILVRRALEDGLPDSRLEPVMARLCRRYGLAKPRFQYDVHDAAGRFIGRVDFAYPDLKVAIEIDGWSSRATPERFDHDLWRQNRLTLAGWTFLRFTKRRIIGEPAQVAAAIRDHLRAKSAA